MGLSDEIMTDIGHRGAAVGADTYRHSATPSNDASTSYATSPRRDQIASRQPGG